MALKSLILLCKFQIFISVVIYIILELYYIIFGLREE